MILFFALKDSLEILHHMSTEKVVIIIPTYNEAAGIEDTLTAVFHTTQSIAAIDLHVLVFDSASTDATQSIVTALQAKFPNVHLQCEAKKSGLGSAYRQAMHYALTQMAADIIFEFDADLSHKPEYIAPMLAQLKTCDVVLGSRYVKGGSIPSNWGWHRKALSVMGNWVARRVLTHKYKDFTSGFRATRRKALLNVLPANFLSNQYAYKLELLWLLHKSHARICEYPIEFIDREKGLSKLPANSIFDSLRVVFTLRFSKIQRYVKMCLVGLTGMSVQFVAYNVARFYLPPFHAAQLAVTVAIINNFILNGLFTFKESRKLSGFDKIKSLSLFVIYSIAIIYFQSFWLEWGVKILGAGHLKENLIVMTGMVIGSFLNYFIYSRIVWRQDRSSTS